MNEKLNGKIEFSILIYFRYTAHFKWFGVGVAKTSDISDTFNRLAKEWIVYSFIIIAM